jgi:hypothetical protein
MSKEIICHELPAVGKYRVRLVKEDLKAPVALDVREYVKGREFEGFTRRGIKLSTTKDIMALRDDLNVVLAMLEVKS